MDSQKKLDRKNRKLKKAEAFLALVKTKKVKTEDSSSYSSSEDLLLPSSRHRVLHCNSSSKHELSLETDNTDNMDNSTSSAARTKEEMDEEKINEMRRIKREKKQAAMERPKVFLALDEMQPYKKDEEDDGITPPLYPLDVQHLLLYALQGNLSSVKPRWCKLLRVAKVSSVVVIFLDGVGYSDMMKSEDCFDFVKNSFDCHMEVVCPEQYGKSVMEEIITVPMSISQIKKANVKLQEEIRKHVASKIMPKSMRKSFKAAVAEAPIIKDKVAVAGTPIIKDKFSRVCLLLSTHQMKIENYPLPVQTQSDQYKDFIFSKDQYTKVTPESPLFGLDCEMCRTTAYSNELTRVSVVDESGKTVYDTLVKPFNPITNYMTQYSGITKEMLDPIEVRLSDVQAAIRELLPSDAILCGQSLNCDLVALKLFHPYVIDTSVIFNTSGNRGIKAGLRKLSGFFLNRNIQKGHNGHCSIEDATATLDLVKLKLTRGLDFGDATINGVYFPDVHTYFLENSHESDGDGGDVKSEKDSENTQPVSVVNGSVTESNSCSSPLKRLNSDSLNQPDVKRIKRSPTKEQSVDIFNQNNSIHVNQSFFKLVEESGHTAAVIGRDTVTSVVQESDIELHTVSSDKEACKAAREAVQRKYFSWVEFSSYRLALNDPDSTEETFEKIQKKMNRRVQKVVSATKSRSLVVVMSTGNQTAMKSGNACVFMKIT